MVLDSLGLDSLGDLGLGNIFAPILKPINNIFGSIGNLIKIIVGVILFFLIGVPILKWVFRQLFGSKQPQYPYPPPGYYPPMGYSTPSNIPPMSYPPAPN
jgi:hypothetical protein